MNTRRSSEEVSLKFVTRIRTQVMKDANSCWQNIAGIAEDALESSGFWRSACTTTANAFVLEV